MFWFVAAIVVVLDQAVKYLVVTQMQVGQSIPIIEGLFHLTYVLNRGAAFSILQGQRWFFVLATSLVLLGALWFLRTIPKKQRLTRLGLGLFCGGAIGNLLDRIRVGAVTDIFDFRVFPVFNVADSAIVVGVILLGLYLIQDERRRLREEKR